MMQQEVRQYTQSINYAQIKNLSTEVIKQYLYGKVIKPDTMNYEMLVELNIRKQDVTKYEMEMTQENYFDVIRNILERGLFNMVNPQEIAE